LHQGWGAAPFAFKGAGFVRKSPLYDFPPAREVEAVILRPGSCCGESLPAIPFCYRDEICVIFTGWPISVAGSAPAFGMNFCVRPPNVSAA
jgi:hypothetical protein